MGTYRRIEHPKFQAYDSNGDPLSGGLLYTYEAGNSTPKATYDADDSANDNPVVLDSDGRAEIYGTGFYKFVLKNSDGETQWTLDNIQGIGETSIVDIGDYAGDFDAAITAISTTATHLHINSTATMSAAVTVPTTCAVEVLKGGTIDQAGNALTFNGPLIMNGGTITNDAALTINGVFPDPGLVQVFTDSGAVSGLYKLYPEWWGAVADGSTDDATAISRTFTAAPDGSTVYFSEGLGYGIASAVTCGKLINIDMLSPIIYTGAADITALTVGVTGTANVFVELRLRVKRNTQSDWTSDSNIGVKLFNIHTSKVYLDDIRGFTINVQLLSEDAGVGYNTFHVGYIFNAKYGIDLYAGHAGWVNDNVFIGGRFGIYSTVNNTLDRYGVRLTSDDDAHGATYYYNNSNTFIKPGFEMGKTFTTGEAIGILIDYGQMSRFVDARDEDNDYLAKIGNASDYNNFEILYGEGDLLDTSTYRNNFVSTLRLFGIEGDKGSTIFDSGPVHKRACYYDGATAIHVPNTSLSSSTDATLYNSISLLVMTDDYLELPSTRGMGIFIKTSNQKRFVIRTDTEADYEGRRAIRAYDSSDTVLTNLGGGHPYVTGQAYQQISWSASFGGIYKTGADAGDDLFFTVGDDVDYIFVMQIGGTAAVRTRGFSVLSYDAGSPSAWTGYEEFIPGANIGTAAPTEGMPNEIIGWSVGKIIYDASPTSGAQLGWICVRSESSTANGGEPATETDWLVVDDQTATDGDIIGVELDNGAIHWTTVNGAPPGGNVITVTAGVPGGRTIADGATVLWYHFQALANIS